MKIKSITDVISNSSDEVYIYKSNANPKKVLHDLRKILGPDHATSGMGGILEVVSDINDFTYPIEAYVGFPKGYLFMDIDHGYYKDLKPYLDEHFGKELSEEEIDKLCLPYYQKQYKESLEKVEKLPENFEITDKIDNLLVEWWNSRADVLRCGGKVENKDAKKYLKPFMDYALAKSQEFEEKYSKNSEDDDSYYAHQCYSRRYDILKRAYDQIFNLT